MGQLFLVLAMTVAVLAPNVLAQPEGPYKVLKTAKVGGDGGWDYIFADSAASTSLAELRAPFPQAPQRLKCPRSPRG